MWERMQLWPGWASSAGAGRKPQAGQPQSLEEAKSRLSPGASRGSTTLLTPRLWPRETNFAFTTSRTARE